MISVDLGPFKYWESYYNLNHIVSIIRPLLLIDDDILIINLKWEFIYWYILILLWSFLNDLKKKYKNIKLNSNDKILNFLMESWFIDYLNNGTLNPKRWSVILPFSNFSSRGLNRLEDYTKYCESYYDGLPKYFRRYPMELFVNSTEHGSADNICVLAQLYPRVKKLDYTIYDDGVWLLQGSINNNEYIEKSKERYLNNPMNFSQKYWQETIIAILCVATTYSTRIWGWWWNGLYELSKFLFEKNWILRIYTRNKFLLITFNKICNTWKLNIEDIKITEKEASFLDWTYINFTFDFNFDT